MTTVARPEANRSENSDDLLAQYLPVYDVAITEHLVIDADIERVFRAARDLDFLTVRSPLLTASMFVRGVPARIRGHAPTAPPELRLAAGSMALPGWLLLGEIPGQQIAFGAVGKFWKADIEWRDVPREHFATFGEPGWGKIACRFQVRANGPGRSTLTYECRTATTDTAARQQMARYWWLIRPFVGHIMRATLRTVSVNTGPS